LRLLAVSAAHEDARPTVRLHKPAATGQRAEKLTFSATSGLGFFDNWMSVVGGQSSVGDAGQGWGVPRGGL